MKMNLRKLWNPCNQSFLRPADRNRMPALRGHQTHGKGFIKPSRSVQLPDILQQGSGGWPKAWKDITENWSSCIIHGRETWREKQSNSEKEDQTESKKRTCHVRHLACVKMLCWHLAERFQICRGRVRYLCIWDNVISKENIQDRTYVLYFPYYQRRRRNLCTVTVYAAKPSGTFMTEHKL